MTESVIDIDIATATAREGAHGWRLKVGIHVLAFVAVLALWALVANRGWISPRILPPPAEVAESWWNLVSDGILVDNLWVTLWAVFAGFILGSAGAFLIAVVASNWPTFRQVVWPYMVALQVTPRVAIAPLLFIWLGFGVTPKVVLAATICFFPVLINSLTGLMLVDEGEDELFRSLGATRRQRFFRLSLPGALPVIFAGLKTAISLALIGAIVGEFVSAQKGLGLLIQRFSFQLNTSAAWAVLLTLTAIGLALYALMEFIDRLVVFWNQDDRLHKRSERAASRYWGTRTVRPQDSTNPTREDSP